MKIFLTITLITIQVALSSADNMHADKATQNIGFPPDRPANLGFFAQKVRLHEPVTIAFLGGSITQGTGSSKWENSYVQRTAAVITAEINRRGGTVKVINDGIGGTDSRYGAFRIGAQVLIHHPDLLVIEFAVNDCLDNEDSVVIESNAIAGTEGIVRQALQQNPKTAIIFFYTTTALLQMDYISQGRLPPSIMGQHRVAQHYGLTEVMVGKAVQKGLDAGTFTTATFFLDGTHPTDLGHQFYANLLAPVIIQGLNQPVPSAIFPLPTLLGSGQYEHARLREIIPVGAPTGWTKSDTQWNWLGVPIWKCDLFGKPIDFEIDGKAPVLIYMGKITVSWTQQGKVVHQELTGHSANMPRPTSWEFPRDFKPNGQTVSVEALATSNGEPHGEVWGVFQFNN